MYLLIPVILVPYLELGKTTCTIWNNDFLDPLSPIKCVMRCKHLLIKRGPKNQRSYESREGEEGCYQGSQGTSDAHYPNLKPLY